MVFPGTGKGDGERDRSLSRSGVGDGSLERRRGEASPCVGKDMLPAVALGLNIFVITEEL